MHEVFHLTFSKDLRGENYYYAHFIDEESEATGSRAGKYQGHGFKGILHGPTPKGREYGDG